MISKFQRSCRLEIGPDPLSGTKPIIIPPEFTVEFEVVRTMLSSAQEGTFRVFNLGLETRDRIFKDFNTVPKDGETVVARSVRFFAGYGDNLPLVFSGILQSATSHRNGVDFVTEIKGGGWASTAHGNIAATKAFDSFGDLLRNLWSKIPGATGAPIISDKWEGIKPTRPVVLMGNAWNLISKYASGKAFIDNGQLKVIDDDEVILGEIAKIDADHGLLGSPKRGVQRMEVSMLFEPRLTAGQEIELVSESWPTINRKYKVAGFTHHGIISPAVAGDCRTEVILQGPWNFRIIKGKAVVL